MKIALWLVSWGAVVVLLAGMGCCWSNRSGHTAIDPYLGFGFLGPVFAIGLAARLLTRGAWLSARITEVIGFVGLAFILFVTKLGILNPYETWVEAGMPNRNPHADWLLAGFLVGGLGGALVVAWIVTPKPQAGSSKGG
jgi:hypothetical protein